MQNFIKCLKLDKINKLQLKILEKISMILESHG